MVFARVEDGCWLEREVLAQPAQVVLTAVEDLQDPWVRKELVQGDGLLSERHCIQNESPIDAT